jgi:MYXO-CTERM domain-containing protein
VLSLALIAAAAAGPNTAMVGFEQPADMARVQEATLAAGGKIRGCYRVARLCVLDFPGEPPLEALGRLPGVRYVERDALMDVAPAGYTDPAGTRDCPDLWDLEAIDIGAAWSAAGGQGESAPVVAIQDSGFLTSHVDLQGVVSGQFDYGEGDPDPEVTYSVSVPDHGTFIAGIIAAEDTNDVGRAGVIPRGQLNLQKIADNYGNFYYSYAINALADLADGDLGVGVLSYSIAGSGYTDAFRDAVDALADVDILMVAAAGNCSYAHCPDADNDAHPLYPASFSSEHIVAVAGSTQDGSLNSYSHYGASSVDLAAPGVDLCSLGVGSDTDTYTASGTSYATPLVAGVAALVMGAWPELSIYEVARVLRASVADNPDLDGLVRAGGVLNAERAVRTAVPRLDAPIDQVFAGETSMGLDIASVAAEGVGVVLLTHPAALEVISEDADWTAAPFSRGDPLELPDAGAHTAESAGTLLTGPLPERTTFTLPLTLRAHAILDDTVTARLVATSDGADYLNAPYNEGRQDETGFLAWTFSATATEAWEAPSDTDPPDSGGDDGGEDSEPQPLDTDPPAADTAPPGDGGGHNSGGGGEEDPGTKSCASGGGAPAAPGALLLALVGILAPRRRRSA